MSTSKTIQSQQQIDKDFASLTKLIEDNIQEASRLSNDVKKILKNSRA